MSRDLRQCTEENWSPIQGCDSNKLAGMRLTNELNWIIININKQYINTSLQKCRFQTSLVDSCLFVIPNNDQISTTYWAVIELSRNAPAFTLLFQRALRFCRFATFVRSCYTLHNTINGRFVTLPSSKYHKYVKKPCDL